MTVDELRHLQDREATDRHLIAVDDDGDVVIAHTRDERALAAAGGPGLDQCPVEVWARRYPPDTPGIYNVARQIGAAGSSAYALERAKVTV